jgi:hypothetical protein
MSMKDLPVWRCGAAIPILTYRVDRIRSVFTLLG